MAPSVRSSGSFFCSILLQRVAEGTCAAKSGSALVSSASKLSFPGAFPFLRDLMAAMISSFSGGVVLTSRSVSGFCSSSIVCGGLLRTSLKCSAHLASCSASAVSGLHCLSTIGVLVAPWYLPVMSLVILDRFPVGSLFCLTCQVFYVGPVVCPCHPLHCLVCWGLYCVDDSWLQSQLLRQTFPSSSWAKINKFLPVVKIHFICLVLVVTQHRIFHGLRTFAIQPGRYWSQPQVTFRIHRNSDCLRAATQFWVWSSFI